MSISLVNYFQGPILTAVSVTVATSLASPTWSQSTLPKIATSCSQGDAMCLDQGWSDERRQWWYTTSQGSRLLPLDWALALKSANGENELYSSESLVAFGYLPNPYSQDNPYGLPVGFAVDHDSSEDADLMCDRFPTMCSAGTMRAPWVGMNCSACHTTEITFDGQRVRVEGAPTLARFDDLVNSTQSALEATIADPDRMHEFARLVLHGPVNDQTKAGLATQLQEQIDWMAALHDINHSDVTAGPGRLDAQGHILTKVSMVIGAETPSTAFSADAPASYPFIWNTHQQAKLQWNGIAEASEPIQVWGRDTELTALVRNVSEVIGVFAHIEADDGWAIRGYDSSVRVRNMVGLERLLSQMTSPVWPQDVLGEIDAPLAARGKDLFEANCRGCHAHLDPTDLESSAQIEMFGLDEAGTDVFLACNTYLRTTDAGNTAGQRSIPLKGEWIEETDAIHKMLTNAASGAIVGKLGELADAVFSQVEPEDGRVGFSGTGDSPILPGVADEEKRAQAKECLNTDHQLLAYKARPLNGIWATAPYLHNGSVPTLYDLLLPAVARNVGEEVTVAGPVRPEEFGIGSREFDPVKVGYVSDVQNAPWVYRVRDSAGNIIPGNSNAGHDYNNSDLTDDERWAIVEYLKGL